ncbi:hypothetical protein [Nocardia brevicatena]|uniref:hypothetical protein n=1 Tax=Nocardia brevicatena TaxID=37327 RepID=UPI000310E16C|nr:hypothetical protein [Nocardia brevicatena]
MLALHALLRGAETVAAGDISVPALVSAWVNGRLRVRRIELLRGDFARVVSDDGGFDRVMAIPPYVPGSRIAAIRGAARACEAGPAGCDALDPLCRLMSRLLRRTAVGLVVHSALCDPPLTMLRLRRGGLEAVVAVRADRTER